MTTKTETQAGLAGKPGPTNTHREGADVSLSAGKGASLELRNLVKHYGAEVAVSDVSLDIAGGEFLTLLGPSGSGKTTTLNMIAGFAEVNEGTIRMDGQPIEDLAPHRRNIGMVFQNYALFPHMTVAENIAFPLKQRKVPKAERSAKVKQALELVRLGDFEERKPRQLSGGQQQRVALARAIVFEPRLLLMDEPLGALDKKLREWLQLEFKRIHSELGITFIYVTHDQEEALVLSDRIAVFSEGRIEQVGTADELYERPASLFVADFLGESNVFAGRVEGSGRELSVACDGFRLRGLGQGEIEASSPGAVVVRPERVRLRTNGTTPGAEENVLGGVIEQVVYLGSARKLKVALGSAGTAVVREQAGAWSGASEGDSVEICWGVSDGVVLPDGAGRFAER